MEVGFGSWVWKLGLEVGFGSWFWKLGLKFFVVVWLDALFGGHVLSVCGLCWFVFMICSFVIGGIVCLAVCLMRFFRCLNLLSALGFDVIGLFFGGWVWGFGVGGNVVLGVCILFV